MLVRGSLLALSLLLSACSKPGIYPKQCSALLPKWRKPAEGYGILVMPNRIRLRRDGSLMWNGERISEARLATYSHASSELNPRPFIILQIDPGTDCGRVRVIRNLVDEQAKCQEYPRLCSEGPDPWARISDVPPFSTFYLNEEEGPKKP